MNMMNAPRNLNWCVLICIGIGVYLATKRKPVTKFGFVIAYTFFGLLALAEPTSEAVTAAQEEWHITLFI